MSNGVLFYLPNARQLSISGTILPGWKLKFFLSTTLTPTPVYADAALTVPLGTTVTASLDGHMPPIYLDKRLAYRLQIYDASNVLQPDGDVDPFNSVDVDAAVQSVIVETFTANGTWNKSAGAKFHDVYLVAGGGGGASGINQSAGNAAGGGGGGGAGRCLGRFLTSGLTATVTVVVGQGGAGGIARAGTDDGAFRPGSNGGTTSFGAYLSVGGGFGALDNGANIGATAAQIPGSGGGNGGVGGSGGASPAPSLLYRFQPCTGGGGGGSGNNGAVQTGFPGGVGGGYSNIGVGGTTGGLGGLTGQPGATGPSEYSELITGLGGGGGGARGAGGIGGFPGGGGGGGGGGNVDNPHTGGSLPAGNGGAGGNGVVIVITYR